MALGRVETINRHCNYLKQLQSAWYDKETEQKELGAWVWAVLETINRHCNYLKQLQFAWYDKETEQKDLDTWVWASWKRLTDIAII